MTDSLLRSGHIGEILQVKEKEKKRSITNCITWIMQIIVSHKIEYTPHISAINLVYIFKGQYYRNETWIYFRVVNVQLV